jgi:hypothetical protein
MSRCQGGTLREIRTWNRAVRPRRFGMSRWQLIVTAVAVAMTATVVESRQDPPVNAYGAAVKAFRDRADEYLALHKKAAGGLPALKETDDPTKLQPRQQALGEAIRHARAGAQAGDLFGPEIGARARKVVRENWADRGSQDKAAIKEDIPPGWVAKVNATYPSSLPLATFPASLLAELPPLPEGLEYRFAGRHLIIRDAEANIIVDVLPDVLPAPKRPRT